jgi:hypothetical protein
MQTTLNLSQNETVMSGLVQEGSLQFMIYPFFSNELADYGKVITFSDQVERAKNVYCGKEKVGLILPYREGDNLFKTLKKYQEDIKSYVGMQITIFSLYDFSGNKVEHIEFFKEGY